MNKSCFYVSIPNKFEIIVSRFDVTSIPVCITLQRFRQFLKELIQNLNYTDEDQKSETIVYSYPIMEKVLICFEKKNLQYTIHTCIFTHCGFIY